MKTSIYITDKDSQIILQPENDYEKDIIKKAESNEYTFEIKKGEFYHCQGGYSIYRSFGYTDDNMMIVLTKKEGKNEVV